MRESIRGAVCGHPLLRPDEDGRLKFGEKFSEVHLGALLAATLPFTPDQARDLVPVGVLALGGLVSRQLHEDAAGGGGVDPPSLKFSSALSLMTVSAAAAARVLADASVTNYSVVDRLR